MISGDRNILLQTLLTIIAVSAKSSCSKIIPIPVHVTVSTPVTNQLLNSMFGRNVKIAYPDPLPVEENPKRPLKIEPDFDEGEQAPPELDSSGTDAVTGAAFLAPKLLKSPEPAPSKAPSPLSSNCSKC